MFFGKTTCDYLGCGIVLDKRKASFRIENRFTGTYERRSWDDVRVYYCPIHIVQVEAEASGGPR